jgi:hypothetical protein
MSDKKLTCKFGDMEEAEEFSVTPFGDGPNERLLQSDFRLAKVDLVKGNVILSKSSCEKLGFIHLLEQFGATEYECAAEIIEELKKIKVRDFSLVD